MSDIELTIDTPIFGLVGELWEVQYEYFWENVWIMT